MPPALTPWPASRYDQDEVCAAPVHLAAHHIVDAQEHDSLTAQRHLRNQCELLSDGRENYTRAARECAPTFRYFIHAGARDPTGRAMLSASRAMRSSSPRRLTRSSRSRSRSARCSPRSRRACPRTSGCTSLRESRSRASRPTTRPRGRRNWAAARARVVL